MAKGDHLFVNLSFRGIPYQHHGVDMGDGTVIHLSPSDGTRIALSDASDRFTIRRDSLQEFCHGKTPVVKPHANARPAECIVAAAVSQLGRTGYSLLEGNCEHFASWCVTGELRSDQIEMGQATVSAVASMATKAVWCMTGRAGTRLALRSVARVHPAAMLADGVEVAVLAMGCRQGMRATRVQAMAKWSATVTAAGIGGLLGGPAGIAAGVATHAGSTAVADSICRTLRRVLS